MKYFTKLKDGTLVPINDYRLATYGYYLSGCRDVNDKGKLSVLGLDPETGGTCLESVYDENGVQICDISKADQYFK